jgi:Na+/proline symporter
MNPILVLSVFVGYVMLLMFIAHRTSKKIEIKSESEQFFIAGRTAPWYVVAFGMLGASLSGVTFISVPGWVGTQGFTYMQMVIGYLAGYAFIMAVLLPLYYRMGLTSIYGYFQNRFGPRAYRTGAAFFVLSRTIGASFRLFLVALVLQMFVLSPLGWDFRWQIPLLGDIPIGLAITVAVIIGVIYRYTRKGGMGTIIWTDTLQTAAMLIAVILAVIVLARELQWNLVDLPTHIRDTPWSTWWVFDDWKAPNHALKHFLAGAFVAIAMTGMDQDMMQKNLACKSVKEARWNMGSFSIVLVFINVLFLSLGVMLYAFANQFGIPIDKADALFPTVALNASLGVGLGLAFLIGLLASAFSSADSALTALTTSICIDLIQTENMESHRGNLIRKKVHVWVSVSLFAMIMLFSAVQDESVVAAIFTAANYTYGPLLGLFAFGLSNRRAPNDYWIPWIAVFSPLFCFALETWLQQQFNFSFGFALLPVNGLTTFLGLFLISRNSSTRDS